MEAFGGEFPETVAAVSSLPGIGPSTAGAIISLSRQQRAVIMDGNVRRVLSRFHAVPEMGSTLDKILWAFAEQHTPAKRVHHFNQAMMDLGATICTRSKPTCLLCPLHTQCMARADGEPTAYPTKKMKKAMPEKFTNLLMFVNEQGEVLLEQRPAPGIWGGLWSFPETAAADATTLKQILKADWAVSQRKIETWLERGHTFSHYHLRMQPVLVHAEPMRVGERAQRWCRLDAMPALGLPAPIKQLLHELAAHKRAAHEKGDV